MAVRIQFRRGVRHPLYPALRTALAVTATGDVPALCGALDELMAAAESGIRVERAVFPLLNISNPFLTAMERDILWNTFQVPVYALLVDCRGQVVAYECEAQDGLHLADNHQTIPVGPTESRLCECGRRGQRLMAVAEEWPEELVLDRLAG